MKYKNAFDLIGGRKDKVRFMFFYMANSLLSVHK